MHGERYSSKRFRKGPKDVNSVKGRANKKTNLALQDNEPLYKSHQLQMKQQIFNNPLLTNIHYPLTVLL